jgi:hypothetical protein
MESKALAMHNSTFTPKPDAKRLTAKPAKPRKCAYCRESFVKQRMGQVACRPACAAALVLKAKAEVERKSDKDRKEALKGIPALKKEAQVAFNAFIRERDKDQPCISCGKPAQADYGYQGGRDAGHYRSTGSADHLRFHEQNCHAQCVKCNQWDAGKAVDYRIGLVKRIGIERVESIENDNHVTKWTAEKLREIKAHYRAKLRELKKAGE